MNKNFWCFIYTCLCFCESRKFSWISKKKAPAMFSQVPVLWSHQGLNLGPPDYESGATNQLSYRTFFRFFWLIASSDCASLVGHYQKVTPSLLACLPCTKTKTNIKIYGLLGWFLRWTWNPTKPIQNELCNGSANILYCMWFGVVTEPHCKYNTFFD